MFTRAQFTDAAFLDQVAEIALRAGAEIMRHDRQASATSKADGSLVTAADKAAEDIILPGLADLMPRLPILSEEATASGVTLPQSIDTFAVVDPLDGTREFVEGEPAFTINIGFVCDGEPVAGVVYAPAMGRLWIAGEKAEAMNVPAGGTLAQAQDRRTITTRKGDPVRLAIVASRSHRCPQTDDYIARTPHAALVFEGSALKFCRLAEGEADIYPRFEPTMEWDTAAGHAVLVAAGGALVNPDGSKFRYGKGAEAFRNGPFLAGGDRALLLNMTKL